MQTNNGTDGGASDDGGVTPPPPEPEPEPEPIADLPSEAAEQLPLAATLGSVHDDDGNDVDDDDRTAETPTGGQDTSRDAAAATAAAATTATEAEASSSAAASSPPSGASSVISSTDPSPEKLISDIVADETMIGSATTAGATAAAAAAGTSGGAAGTAAAVRSEYKVHHGHADIDRAPPATGHEFDDDAAAAAGGMAAGVEVLVAEAGEEDEVATPQPRQQQHDMVDVDHANGIEDGDPSSSSLRRSNDDGAVTSRPAAAPGGQVSSSEVDPSSQTSSPNNDNNDGAYNNDYSYGDMVGDGGNRSDSSDDVSSIHSFPGPTPTSATTSTSTTTTLPASPPPVPPSTPIGYPGQKTVLGPDVSMGYVGRGRLKSPPLSGRCLAGTGAPMGLVGGGGAGGSGSMGMPPPPFGMEETPMACDDDAAATAAATAAEAQDGVTTPTVGISPNQRDGGSNINGEGAHVDVPTPSDSAIDAEVCAMPTEKRRGGGGEHGGTKRPPDDGTAAQKMVNEAMAAAASTTTTATAPRPKKRPRKTHTEDFTTWEVRKRYQLMRILGRGSYGEVAQAKDVTYRPAAPSPTNFPPGHPAHVHDAAGTAAAGAAGGGGGAAAGGVDDDDNTRQPEPDDTHDYPDNHGHGPYVAVKRISGAFDQEVDAVRLYREMHILRRLRGHECVIDLIDVIEPARVVRDVGGALPPSSSADNGGGDEDDNGGGDGKRNEDGNSPLTKGRGSNKKYQYPDLTHFTDLYMVFDYVDTDLYKLIMSPQYLTTEHIQTFLYQMLAGIKYIHSASVIHRDLKPANILLNEDCSLKICDFGLARIVARDTMSPRGVSERDGDDASAGNASSSAASAASGANGGGGGGGDSSPGSELSGPSRSPPKPGFTRQLTKHVVTRWYRAPELILIQPYTSAVDIWSIGCILAELLSMQEESVPSYQDRVPLFPGGSCYPLSGEGGSVKSNERLDQLSVIISVIGTPSEEDINSIGKAKDYIATLKKRPGRPIEAQYPAADPLAIDLLKHMLQFNPKKRYTADEALEHPFLQNVRRADMERGAQRPLVGPEFLETNHVDMDELKRKAYDEVMCYRRQK